METWQKVLIGFFIVGIILLIGGISIYFAFSSEPESTEQQQQQQLLDEINKEVQQQILNQELSPDGQTLTYQERYQLLLEERLAEIEAQQELDNLLNANANANTNANENINGDEVSCPKISIDEIYLKELDTYWEGNKKYADSKLVCKIGDGSLYGQVYNDDYKQTYMAMHDSCDPDSIVQMNMSEIDGTQYSINQCNTEVGRTELMEIQAADPRNPGVCAPSSISQMAYIDPEMRQDCGKFVNMIQCKQYPGCIWSPDNIEYENVDVIYTPGQFPDIGKIDYDDSTYGYVWDCHNLEKEAAEFLERVYDTPAGTMRPYETGTSGRASMYYNGAVVSCKFDFTGITDYWEKNIAEGTQNIYDMIAEAERDSTRYETVDVRRLIPTQDVWFVPGADNKYRAVCLGSECNPDELINQYSNLDLATLQQAEAAKQLSEQCQLLLRDINRTADYFKSVDATADRLGSRVSRRMYHTRLVDLIAEFEANNTCDTAAIPLEVYTIAAFTPSDLDTRGSLL